MDRVSSISPAVSPRDAPGPNVVEVNLFGPGYGESVLVHLGSNQWLVVDSCAPYDEAEPIALTYLRRIGVNFSRAVKYIVATHWHDDHIRGFSRLVRSCPRADVFLSSALTHRPLMRLVRANVPRHVPNLREMNRSIDTLLSRRRRSGQPYSFLLENTVLHSTLLHPDNSVEIWALSPSAIDVREALRQIRHLLREEDRRKIPAVPDPRENRASVVLHVRSGNQQMLLGADREIQRSHSRGWASVGACVARRGLGRATLLKVAHHGSPNGDSEIIWRDLLEKDPVAVLTPFRRGNEGGRPRAEDVASLCARTRWLFTTSAPGLNDGHQLQPTEPVSEAEAAIGVEVIEPAQLPLGHIRARADAAGGPWSVDLVRPAAHLCRGDVSREISSL